MQTLLTIHSLALRYICVSTCHWRRIAGIKFSALFNYYRRRKYAKDICRYQSFVVELRQIDFSHPVCYPSHFDDFNDFILAVGWDELFRTFGARLTPLNPIQFPLEVKYLKAKRNVRQSCSEAR